MSLSEKNLRKAFGWCEANEGNPLAEKYLSICGAIGNPFDVYSLLRDSVEAQGPVRNRRYNHWLSRINAPDGLLYVARDAVGRMILDGLRLGHLPQ